MNRAYADPSSELHRKLNPEWRFSDTSAFLLAELATITSSLRYFTLVRVMDDVPEAYWPAVYGPRTPEDSPPEDQPEGPSSDDQVRAGADEIRREMGIA